MPSVGARNNILAGLFVIGGLALAVWGSFLLADRADYGTTRRFIVEFTLAQGAAGLKRGSNVNLGGQQVGRVLSVTFGGTDANSAAGASIAPRSVDVEVEARADLTLYESAIIQLEKPLLGSLSSLNIRAIGSPDLPAVTGTSALEEGERIKGVIAPPAFLADAGLGGDQIDQLRHAIGELDKSVTNVSAIVERSGPKIESGITDAQGLLSEMRTNLQSWSTRIDTTVTNVEKASARIDPMLTKVDGGIDESRALIADARAAIADMRSIVDSNRARIDTIIANVESASSKFDTETIQLVNDTLRDAKSSLSVFSDAIADVNRLITEQSPGLRRTLANIRIMSDQLKLTAIEVRSQPWRLLHSPTTKELREQVLYDATRSYAEAASDLRSAAESFQAATAKSAPGAPPDLAAITTALSEAVQRYRQAERYLMLKLTEESK